MFSDDEDDVLEFGGPDDEECSSSADSIDWSECPSCGSAVYEEAQKCPVCGEWIMPGAGGVRSGWWLLVVMLMVAVILGLWL